MPTTVTLPILHDSRVNTTNSASNFGTNTSYTISTTDSVVFNFDWSSIPAGAVISAATLTLKIDTSSTATTATNLIVRALDATPSWSESTVTNSNRPASIDVTGQTVQGTTNKSAGTGIALAVGPALEWSNNNGRNGLIVGFSSGSTRIWASTENTTSTDRPTLSVTYDVPDVVWPAGAGTVSLPASHDTLVQPVEPTSTSGGTSTIIYVGTSVANPAYVYTSYVGFDQLTNKPAGATVTNAVLNLNRGTSTGVAQTVTIKGLTSAFSESTTYNTRPTTTDTGMVTFAAPGGSGFVDSIDITSALNAALAAGQRGIEITAPGPDVIYWNSSEGASPPSLSVTYSSQADIAVTVTPMTGTISGPMPQVFVESNPDANVGGTATNALVTIVQPTVTAIRNVNVTAAPMTSESLIVEPAVVGRSPITYYAGVMEGSVVGPQGSRNTSFATVAVTKDVNSDINDPAANLANDPLLIASNGSQSSKTIYIGWPATVNKADIINATVTLTPTSNYPSPRMTLFAITSPWTEEGLTHNNRPTLVTLGNMEQTAMTANQPAVFNVNSALAQGIYGFAIRPQFVDTSYVFSSSEGTHPPALSMTYEVSPVSVSVEAPVLTGNVTLVEPTVTIVLDVENIVAPATATAEMPQNVVVTTEANPHVTYVAEPLVAALTLSGKYSVSAVVTADVMTAEGEIKVPTITTEQNAIISASAMTAHTRIVPVAEEQSTDLWYERLYAQTDSNDIWLRLNETSGNIANNERGSDGTYIGTPIKGQFGLENRRYVEFNGGDDYIEFPYRSILAVNGTMEMVVKTADADGTLMYGMGDSAYNANMGGFFGLGYQVITNVTLVNGRIRVNLQPYGGRAPTPYFEGGSRIDDNQWHHIVIVWFGGSLQVYVDGKLHFRRQLTDQRHSIVGAPMAIGRDLDGDIMEFIFRADNILSAHDIQQNYYAAFGFVPVVATPMKATATMPAGSKGKGNQKRALALYYYANWDESRTVANHKDIYNWTGITIGTDSLGLNVNQPFEIGGYKVFPKSVVTGSGEEYLSGAYYDEITGEPRYIDVSKDIDPEDYDMIFFINTPPRFNYAAGYGDEPQYLNNLWEKMLDGVRRAVDKGVSFWCPQPEIAVYMGIVDRVENHSQLSETSNSAEQGNASGAFDARSALINPWAGDKGDASDAQYYYDTHRLNRQRIVAKVPGLTDYKGWILEDYFFGRPRDPYKVPFEGWKLKEIPNGLDIGDELFYGQDWFFQRSSSNSMEAYNKRMTVISVPPANVKAGTVVAKENATHWVGTQQVENPYKNYATTIIVQPGDTLKGTPVGGKIFVNFMDGVDHGLLLKRQIVPPNSELVDLRKETPEQRAWQYSSWRVNKTAVSLGDDGSVLGGVVLVPYGTVGNDTAADYARFKDMVTAFQQGKGNIIAVAESEEYPIEFLPYINMVDRGLYWLADRQVTPAGSANVRVSPMTATVTGPDATATSQRSTTIPAQPMVALVGLIKPTSIDDPDVEIRTLPMTATVNITGYGKTIAAAPMTASVRIVENFDMVMAGGEQVVVYLHHADANLYILEEE